MASLSRSSPLPMTVSDFSSSPLFSTVLAFFGGLVLSLGVLAFFFPPFPFFVVAMVVLLSSYFLFLSSMFSTQNSCVEFRFSYDSEK